MSKNILERAIVKAERLLAESTQGEWVVAGETFGADIETSQGDVLASFSDRYAFHNRVDAELIVSLHPLLPLLVEQWKEGVDNYQGTFSAFDHWRKEAAIKEWWDTYDNAIELAKAFLEAGGE